MTKIQSEIALFLPCQFWQRRKA